jgi:hypothetical protein
MTCGSISSNLAVQNVVHRTTANRVTMSFPDVLSSFEVSREVTGQIRNNSTVSISVMSIIARSLYLNGRDRNSASYDFNNSVEKWVSPSQLSIAPNSSLNFSHQYVQFVSANYGAFVDSFDSKVDVTLKSLNPFCDFAK